MIIKRSLHLQHNMKIKEIRILKVEFFFNKDFQEKKGTIPYNPNIAIRHKFLNETNELFVCVGLKQKSGDVPYYFEVEGAGLFKFDTPPKSKILDTFSNINCPAIIFPYVRETIADITRRAGFPSLHLNPINFVELDRERRKQATKEKTTPK